MSSRIIAAAARRIALSTPRRLAYHTHGAGGLLRSGTVLNGTRLRRWPLGACSVHNVPAVRSISFLRVIPSLFLKLVRVPALFGGAALAGLAYIQYQAQQAGTYALDLFGRASDTVTSTAGSVWETGGDIASRTRAGWQRTTEGLSAPAWLRNIMESGGKEEGVPSNGQSSSGGGTGGAGGGGPQPKESAMSGGAAAGGATAAAFGLTSDSEDDNREKANAAKDGQMMLLTKKMIEIRSLLQTVGQSDSLILPSIVVIGSQSSGKSSVLEAIVGHEFLPKGSNMVTRRPIELTLVNTPEAKAEYGEFPALGLGKITDFLQIQRTLTDLNLAVPVEQCVSDDPIQLRIYSSKIPDLSLIDLPGYIQVVGHDQPLELKQKISDLCDKYIKSPNIILAISAADVDLANSTSLQASRRVDPRGERTIGVITKMDLVDPIRGADVLQDKNYPLRLGYVGVVCKIPSSSGLFAKGGGNITNALVKNESAYFSAHPTHFGHGSEVEVGTTNLRKKLMYVLERTLANSLGSTAEAIQTELAETTYEFKVQYNDRPLSAESYLAESLDAFKHSFRALSDSFGRTEIRQLLKHEIDQQVLNLLAQRYWNKPIDDLMPVQPDTEHLSDLPRADPEAPLWHLKLDASTSSLTKLGIGRLATGVVAASLQARIDQLVANSTFSHHPFARQAITEASSTILRELSYDTSDELEICLKPYKYRIEVEDGEWAKAKENVAALLKDELVHCDDAFKHAEQEIGGSKKMRDVLTFIDRVRKGDIVLEGDGTGGAGGFSAALLRRGKCWKSLLMLLNMSNCLLQVGRLYSFAIALTSSACVWLLLAPSNVATERTNTTAQRFSSMPLPISCQPQLISSSMLNCYPSFITR